MDDGYDHIVAHAAEPVFGIQVGKRAIRVHAPDQCAGEFCCIHNPSDHPLKDAPLNFRFDRGALAERMCEHGVGHPDPDSLAFRNLGEYDGVHGCDGCCS